MGKCDFCNKDASEWIQNPRGSKMLFFCDDHIATVKRVFNGEPSTQVIRMNLSNIDRGNNR